MGNRCVTEAIRMNPLNKATRSLVGIAMGVRTAKVRSFADPFTPGDLGPYTGGLPCGEQ